MSWLRKVFELNDNGLNWPRGVMILDALLVPLVVFWAIGYEQYLLSAVFAVLLTAVTDPGGSYWYRTSHNFVFALFGAGVTALGFGIGTDAWGWLVLASFLFTLVAGLTVVFGVHRFVAAYLLNVWFIVAIAVAFAFHQHALITSYTWAQVVAYAGGSVLWIVLTCIAWLVRGRHDRPQPIAEIPGDISRRKLSRPVLMFMVLRALVLAGTVALTFGANLSYGYWMSIAAIVAMKPALDQSTLFGAQRLAGALIGAGAAILLLLIPANEHGLRLLIVDHGLTVVALVLMMHAAATRMWNYALYCGVVAAAVLLLVDLPQPTNYSAEGYRVLWTLCGVGLSVIVMLLAELLGRRRAAKAPPRPAKQPA
ncbi:MAG TPA: FUSC family protein [Trebonia sp.]|nr:FUSC family protein [Trebonia sp.]